MSKISPEKCISRSYSGIYSFVVRSVLYGIGLQVLHWFGRPTEVTACLMTPACAQVPARTPCKPSEPQKWLVAHELAGWRGIVCFRAFSKSLYWGTAYPDCETIRLFAREICDAHIYRFAVFHSSTFLLLGVYCVVSSLRVQRSMLNRFSRISLAVWLPERVQTT